MGVLSLSICIPTYNFGPFIGETLASIARQAAEGVEVVVVDGASTDNTPEVVARFRDLIPRLRYLRLDARGGIDADMARSVQLAEAPYCWLLSADDILEDGALHRVLREIRGGRDLYLCGLTLCTQTMVPIRRHCVLRLNADTDFELSDRAQRLFYFGLAETSTAFFSYMSSLVINRMRWEAAGTRDAFMGTSWAHVARIFGMIPQGFTVRYLPSSYVLNRGGNDSFLEGGVINRIGIAVNGYWRLAEVYFGESSAEARHIRRVVGNEFRIRYILSARANARLNGQSGDEQALDRIVAKLYQDDTLENRILRFAYKAVPLPIARVAYSFFKQGLRNR